MNHETLAANGVGNAEGGHKGKLRNAQGNKEKQRERHKGVSGGTWGNQKSKSAGKAGKGKACWEGVAEWQAYGKGGARQQKAITGQGVKA